MFFMGKSLTRLTNGANSLCSGQFCLIYGQASVLLPLVLSFAQTLEDGKPGLLRVRDGQRLEFHGRSEPGNNFAHGLFARRAIRQRLGRERPMQGEFSAAHLAVAVSLFVFV